MRGVHIINPFGGGMDSLKVSYGYNQYSATVTFSINLGKGITDYIRLNTSLNSWLSILAHKFLLDGKVCHIKEFADFYFDVDELDIKFLRYAKMIGSYKWQLWLKCYEMLKRGATREEVLSKIEEVAITVAI